MQNLKYPNAMFLINSLTVDDFGLATDGISGLLKLIGKKIGVTMKDDGAGGMATVTKGCANFGAKTSVTLIINPECPCDECDYEYGFSISKKVQFPGVLNWDRVPEMRSYGGILSQVTCSAGYIVDADKLTMEDDILTQMKDSEMKYSFTEGRRFYKLTDDDASGPSIINITDANGVTTPITTTVVVANTLADKINDDATVSAYVIAFATAEDEVFLTSINPSYLFTATAGTDVTIVERGIWIQSKRDEYDNAEVHFDIEVLKSFGTVKGFNLAKIDASTATATDLNLVTYLATTKAETLNAITAASVANFELAVIAASGATAMYAHRIGNAGTDVYMVGNSTIDHFTVRLVTGSTLVIDDVWNKMGQFPYLTGSGVFKLFANMKDQGDLSNLVYLDQPNPADEYCHYNFEINYANVPAVHGASHKDSMTQIVNLYIKKDQLATDYWDANNYMWDAGDAAYAADTLFDELIFAWCGTNPAS